MISVILNVCCYGEHYFLDHLSTICLLKKNRERVHIQIDKMFTKLGLPLSVAPVR